MIMSSTRPLHRSSSMRLQSDIFLLQSDSVNFYKALLFPKAKFNKHIRKQPLDQFSNTFPHLKIKLLVLTADVSFSTEQLTDYVQNIEMDE